MSYDSLLDRTATRVRLVRGNTDRMGSATPSADADEEPVTFPCRLAASAQREAEENRDTTIDEVRIYLPAGADVVVTDKLEIDGATYEVIGNPVHQHGAALEHHVRLTARKITG